jgi:hypothetical protein
MRSRTLIAVAAGIAALAVVAGAGAAHRTTAPDKTIYLHITVTDKTASIGGNAQWSKIVELPRGTYGRLVITNTGAKAHFFAVSGLPRGPKISIKPGKRIVVVADFLTRGDFPWSVDNGSTHAGVFRIF